jgi:hypothetical protein
MRVLQRFSDIGFRPRERERNLSHHPHRLAVEKAADVFDDA